MTEIETKQEFKKELYVLQQTYLKKLRAHASEIRRSSELFSQGLLPLKDLQNLYRISHNFSGSGTTFGFPDISRIASELHQALKEFLDKENSLQNMSSSEYSIVLETMKQFEQICRNAVAKDNFEQIRENSLQDVTSAIQSADVKTIGLLAHKSDAAQDLTAQLKSYGYAVLSFKSVSDLKRMIEDSSLYAVIIFNNLSSTEKEHLEIVLAKDAQNRSLPIVVMSNKNDFSTRLSALKIGAEGFLPEDADSLNVIGKIEELYSSKKTKNDYSVLIIDDDAMLSEFYSHTLKYTGKMNPVKLSNSKDVFKALAQQPIDLIMIDGDISSCTGKDMINLIRQNDDYCCIPILLVCKKEDLEAYSSDIDLKSEQVLPKPFTPEQLIGSVRRTIKQSEIASANFDIDLLTKTLRRSVFLEKSNNILSDITAKNKDLSFASVVISNFDAINKKEGYLKGDHLLKSLAHLLKQFSAQGLIGYMNTNEFAVLFEDDAKENQELFKAVKVAFNELHGLNYNLLVRFSSIRRGSSLSDFL